MASSAAAVNRGRGSGTAAAASRNSRPCSVVRRNPADDARVNGQKKVPLRLVVQLGDEFPRRTCSQWLVSGRNQ